LQCPFIAKSEDHTRHRQLNVLKSFARSNLAIGGRIENAKGRCERTAARPRNLPQLREDRSKNAKAVLFEFSLYIPRRSLTNARSGQMHGMREVALRPAWLGLFQIGWVAGSDAGENTMLSKENCAAILNAGSNLKIPGLPREALVELARIARQRGVRLEIKCGLPPDSMVEIAHAGGTNVVLDVSDYS
jgi:hypothetical protein